MKVVSINLPIETGVLLEGVFSVKDSGIDSKIFHSWKLGGLLPNVPKGEWAKLSFIDVVWLYILETMRIFGCSRKLMKQVSKNILKQNRLYDITTNYLIENNQGVLSIYLDGSFSTNKTDLSKAHIVIPIGSFIKNAMSDSNITRKMLSA